MNHPGSSLDSVSCETKADLDTFAALVRRWNKSINLIAPATEPEIWSRHIADSAQIYPHIPPKELHLVDLGSGGGFPAIVLAILARHNNPSLRVTMIESDARKSAFLRSAIRELSLNASVIVARIEQADPQDADVITARALAPLPKLIPLAQRHVSPSGQMIFPKGANWRQELETTRLQQAASIHPSETSSESAIIVLPAGASPTQ